MPDQNDADGFEDLPEDHPAVKALRAVRSELKAEKAKAKIADLRVTYPDLGLTSEDFEGLTPDKYEARATRLANLRASAAPAQSPEPTETPPQPIPGEDAFKRMSQPLEGTPPNTDGKAIELNEAFALYKRNPVEFERLKQAGLIKNWPSPEDRGGSIVLHKGV